VNSNAKIVLFHLLFVFLVEDFSENQLLIVHVYKDISKEMMIVQVLKYIKKNNIEKKLENKNNLIFFFIDNKYKIFFNSLNTQTPFLIFIFLFFFFI
jgi:hypothetical protein